MTCGANAGDSATTRRTGPDGDDLALGEHDDVVGDLRHELDVVGGHQHRVAVVGEVAQDPGERALGGVVEPAGRLVEQHAPAAGATSTIARASASRWPSERSRGWWSSGMPGTSRSRIARHGVARCRRRRPRTPRRRSRGRAGRRRSAAPGRRSARRRRRRARPGRCRRRRPVRRCAGRCPAAPRAATTCRTPLRPISAVTWPARRSRSTSRSGDRAGRARRSSPAAGDSAVGRPGARRPAAAGRGRSAAGPAPGLAHASAAAATSRRPGPSSTIGGTTGEVAEQRRRARRRARARRR